MASNNSTYVLVVSYFPAKYTNYEDYVRIVRSMQLELYAYGAKYTQ